MDNFDPDELPRHIDEMHSLEHAADTRKHEMLDVLAKAFITPIEREDIIDLSHCIDNMTDKIEDVFLRLYTNNIREMQPTPSSSRRSLSAAASPSRKCSRSSRTSSAPRPSRTISSA